MRTATDGLQPCDPNNLPAAKSVMRIYLTHKVDDVFDPNAKSDGNVYYNSLPETATTTSTNDFNKNGTKNTSEISWR